MASHKPVHVVMADRLQEASAPSTADRLGRPLVGPCLIWTAAADRKGYGVLGNREFGTTSIQRAHRAAYALAHGIPLNEIRTIPEIDHLCRVPLCCAPRHLEAVTHQENVRRGDGGSRQRNATHCVNGHAFTPKNTYLRKDNGLRQCKRCAVDNTRKNYDPAKRAARYAAKKLKSAERTVVGNLVATAGPRDGC